MIKINKKNIILFNLIFFYLFFVSISSIFASEEKKFLSLKKNEVNLRQGPSKNHPIKFVYKKKYLPVEIIDNWDNWRKIKDFENNSGWIHISLLSGKRSVINQDDNSIIFSSNSIYSKPLAKVERGRLLFIKKCKNEWCKIVTGKYSGWIKKKSLWGKIN